MNPATVGDSVSPGYFYFMQLYVTDRLDTFHLDVGLPLLAISSLDGWQLLMQRCYCRESALTRQLQDHSQTLVSALLIFSEMQDLKGQH